MDDKRTSLRLAPAVGVLMLTLLAFGLRLHRLNLQPLWGDEGWSFYFASMSLGEMVRLTAVDIHPPLYYALLSGWLHLAGSTPEAARFLSVLFGTLLIPLTERVATRLFDRPTGLAAGAVVTLSPFAIYYSQEVRMYGLVTLLGLASVYFLSQRMGIRGHQPAQGKGQAKYFWGYVLTTAGALYTMYYAMFLPVFQAVYLLLLAAWERYVSKESAPISPKGRKFLRDVAVVGLLYLPWVVYSGTKLIAYVQGKRVAEGYVSLDFPHFIAAHVVAFSLGHHTGAPDILTWTTLLFLLVALLGLAYRRARVGRFSSISTQAVDHATHRSLIVARSFSLAIRPSSFLLAYLIIPLTLGYLINRIYPFTPRYFERTLMLAAPAWWLLLGAGLAWLWRRSRLAMAGVSVALLLVQTVMLLNFYSLPRYQDEDYRHLLAYVRAHSTPDDVLLASYQWQLGFYYAYLSPPRPEIYVVPGWGETWAGAPARMKADLDTLVDEHSRLWFPAFQSLGRLWETRVEGYLNRAAFPAQVDWSIASTKLTLYARGDRLTPAAAPFTFANLLALERTEVGTSPVEAGRGVLPVTLVWHKLDTRDSDPRIALRLTDASGRTWASRDSLPQGGDASFNDLAVGEQLIDRHGVIVPAGVPPGEYQLRLSVRDEADDRALDLLDGQGQPQGVEATLATVQIMAPATPLSPAALPVQHRLIADFDHRVRLLGYSIGDGPFQAGNSLNFSLFWQALVDGGESYVLFAQLQDEMGRPVALSETPLVYPSDRWTAGTLLRDPREIPLPATLPAGTYRLVVGLLRPDQSRLPVGRDDQLVLTTVETTQRPHDFSPRSPQYPLAVRFGDRARLVGYDLRGGGRTHPGQSLTLVLYWQAMEPFDRSYSVFTHVVDAEDRIVGQRDQVPGGGEFPTTSWVPGEYLVDAYTIPINLDTLPGDYWIEIGFYDPRDGARLPVTDAEGHQFGDRFRLRDTQVRIEE